MLKVPVADVADRVAANVKTLKELTQKGKRAKDAASDDQVSALLALVQEAPADYPVIIGKAAVAEGGALRNLWDVLRARMAAPGAVVLAAQTADGKPLLLAAGTDEAVAKGFDAGALIKAMGPAIRGGGGGKPAMAQAGGKDASGLDAALEIAREHIL